MNGMITAQGLDVVDGNKEFYGNAGLNWDLSSGGSVGEINARSSAELASGVVYNTTGLFDYGNNAYLLSIVDTTSDFLTDAKGSYGGNQFDW
jgi:hypothetical protein